MCSTLTGPPLAHQGGACFNLWWPLRYHKDHPKYATQFPLAVHAAPSWEIYPSLCIMLPIQPLHLPSQPWESISMDFLGGLPTTQKKHDAIWVVVCRFSKMGFFIPCTKTTTAAQTAELYFRHVWPHFGLPITIISDWDSRFLSTFCKTIWALLGCQLKFSTAFHPQTDGQTKVVNRVLVHAL